MQRVLCSVLVALALLLVGCNQHVIRDAAVYQTELTQYDNWATKQADLLAGFMEKSCTCEAVPRPRSGAMAGVDPTEGNATLKFSSLECAMAADFVLTIRARHEWHMQMSLYNGDLREAPPASPPPVIPASSTLCPTGGVQ